MNMKKNDLAEIKKSDIKILLERVKKSRTEIVDLKFEKSMNKLKNLRQISQKRKDLAQILTVLKQKQLLQELEEVNVSK